MLHLISVRCSILLYEDVGLIAVRLYVLFKLDFPEEFRTMELRFRKINRAP